MGSPGYIYALINPALEGLVKVGKTTTNPEKRANELSSATGVPMQFMVAHSVIVANCDLAEKYAHGILEKKGYRISNNREFFQAPLMVVIEAIKNTAGFIGTLSESDYEVATKQTKQSNVPFVDVSAYEELMRVADDYYNNTPLKTFNPHKAIELYKQAAERGCSRAYYMLGIAYIRLERMVCLIDENNKNFNKLFGYGSKTEIQQNTLASALKCFSSAIQKNYDFAYAAVATYYANKKNNSEAKKYWELFFNTDAFLNKNDPYDYLSRISDEYSNFLFFNLNIDEAEAEFMTDQKFDREPSEW